MDQENALYDSTGAGYTTGMNEIETMNGYRYKTVTSAKRSMNKWYNEGALPNTANCVIIDTSKESGNVMVYLG